MPSTSTRSGSGSKVPVINYWTRGRTLSRGIEVEALGDQHLKFLWAAYQKGGLEVFGEGFEKPDGASWNVEEFHDVFVSLLLNTFHFAWIIKAPTVNHGHIPIGMTTAFWSHHDEVRAPFVIIGEIVWFPWASPRNVIEGAVKFFDWLRRDFRAMMYTQDKRFFEIIARHGIMRRVGTSFNVYADGATAVFETRTLESHVVRERPIRRHSDSRGA